MRSLWIILSTIAVANLLGLAAFVGYLAGTDRLSADRLTRIREMLSTTVSAEKDAQAKADADAKASEAKAADEAKMRIPPESSTEALTRTRDEDELSVQRLVRLREEVRQLQDQLASRQSALDRQRAELDAREKALAQKAGQVADTTGSEQFKQALASLEAQKPAEARKVLQALIDVKNTEQAVSYLASMQERTRAKVLAEFIKTDQALAADLLERLRTRGLDALRGGAVAPSPGVAGAASGPAPSGG